MTGRTTAEIVADLRGMAYDFDRHNQVSSCATVREAANRLAELDAQAAYWQRAAEDEQPLPAELDAEVARLRKLRIPCVTCDGTQKVHDSIDTYVPCPDCTDGLMSHSRAYELLAALIERQPDAVELDARASAVIAAWDGGELNDLATETAIDALRELVLQQ